MQEWVVVIVLLEFLQAMTRDVFSLTATQNLMIVKRYAKRRMRKNG